MAQTQTIFVGASSRSIPSTVDEAFRAGRQGGYISSSVVAAARDRWNTHQGEMPLIIGCDFACGGGGGDMERLTASKSDEMEGSEDGDANLFIARRGRVLGTELYERFRDRDTISVTNRLQADIDRLRPARAFHGSRRRWPRLCTIYSAIVGMLKSWNSLTSAAPRKPVDQRKYRNKRSEMYGELRDWLQDGDIPDDPLLETELTAAWVHREDESGLVLAPKREIRKKLKLSPDGADAAALTFAAPVRSGMGEVRVGGSSRR